MTTIVAAAKVQAEFQYDQATVKREIVRWLSGHPALLRLAESFDHALVESRSSVAPIDWVFSTRSFEESNNLYREKASLLATRAAELCLASAGVDPDQIDLIVSTSCTGFMIPSVDAVVAERLGMRRDLRRLPITEHGCAAGVVALSFANDYLRLHQDQRALVLAVELPSVTFQPGDRRPENIISAAIFGDGAAAVLLSGEPRPARPTIVGSHSVRFANTLGLMGFELKDPGLHIVLSRDIPSVVKREVPQVITDFLAAHSLTRRDLSHFLLHPGGRRILEALEETLELPPASLTVSRDVLRTHGNLSSATVLVILHEFLERDLGAEGDLGLMAAFGPGFGAELLLLRW